MKKTRFILFGVLLVAGVLTAVSSVIAQDGPAARARRQVQERHPGAPRRMMLLDGRGMEIGVSVEDASDGVRIGDVDQEGPAGKAGLRVGDVVVEVDGERIRSARQFSRLIQETAQGRSVSLQVMRDGTRQTINVTPQSRRLDPFAGDFAGDIMRRLEPQLRDLEPRWRELEPRLRELEPRLRELEPQLRDLEPRLREFRFDGPMDFNFDFDGLSRLTSPRARLGVQLNELTPQLADYFGAAQGGVLVTTVTKGSPAEKAGIKAGDIITSVDGDRVRATDDLVDELRDKEGDVTITLLRDKRESTVKATLDAAVRPTFRRPA